MEENILYAPTPGNYLVAFQGELGAYSELAVFSRFPQDRTTAVPKKNFTEVFTSVIDTSVDYGMIPVENALAGPIQDNYDLLDQYPEIHIVAETKIRIEHNLIVVPGTQLSQIKKVISHPQALAQSKAFLDGFPDWEIVPFYDTAGSVAQIAAQKDPTIAAIASFGAAKLYKMQILASNIETNQQNFTRFFLIATQDKKPVAQPNKASILFSTPDQPGALSRCLGIFARFNVNLKKLESRPIIGKPWEYKFYVDTDLSLDQKNFNNALEELSDYALECRVLGRYPS